MKKEILLTSLIMMNPLVNVQARELSEVKMAVKKQFEKLADFTFESTATFDGYYWKYDPTRETSDKVFAKYKIVLEFSDNRDEDMLHTEDQLKMEYAFTFKQVFEDGYESYDDMTYRVDRLGKNKFKLYNCDSTLNCSQGFHNSFMTISRIGKDRFLKIDDAQDLFFGEDGHKNQFFIQVK